jgi:pimeloyl-ACP methyl ester carboxylesterase
VTVKTFIHSSGGIDWYCEQRGQGPHLALVPSGEGDCANFETVAAALADAFTVLTFDMPGFSRTSATTDPADIAMSKLDGQIADLVRSLGIDQASFYGCSSGGVAVLNLALNHAALVTNAIVHEAALIDPTDKTPPPPALLRMMTLDDDGVVAFWQTYFATAFNEDAEAWNALGADYHRRLEKNYITWARNYPRPDPSRVFDPAALRGRPLAWTVGGLTPTARTIGNVKLALAAGIAIGVLPCLHFPQVSIPQKLADHIREACQGAAKASA